MRGKVNRGLQFKAFAQSGATEEIITMKRNKTAMKKRLEKGLSSKPLRLRLVRVELDNEVEVLIANLLDNERYPAGGFKALYHLRWGVEENYKRLKMWVELENFTGKSVLSVKQDFYARVLSSNLVAMMSNAAQRLIDRNRKGRRLPYQVNFAQALSKMKNTLVKLILLSSERLKKRLTDLIGYIAYTLEPVRPNRSYDRKVCKTNGRAFSMNYKRAN
ncbi:MAG: hypothetical protein ACI9LY_000769 [Arenicella sp.]|jgi:hypothetical protein